MERRRYGWTEGHIDGQKDTIVKSSFLLIKEFLCNFLNIFLTVFFLYICGRYIPSLIKIG